MDACQQIESIPKSIMTLDCTNLNPGDKVRLRNGTIAPVAINEGIDATEGMPIGIIHSDYVLYFHCPDGKFHHENVDSEYDIVEILTNPKPEMDTTTPTPLGSYSQLSQILIHPDRSAFIDHQGLGYIKKITINGKQYVRADSVSPEVHYKSGSFTAVRSTDNGELLAIWHNEKRFTPADSWPEPITDRKPTEEDADESGEVQVLNYDGDWMRHPWRIAGRLVAAGWARTFDWKPRPIDKKTLLLQDLKRARKAGIPVSHGALDAVIELLEATP